MDKKTALMYGSLLHDIGKIVYRSNDHLFARGTHSKLGHQFLKQFDGFNQEDIIESVAYHHYKELIRANIADDSNAFITYIADNIASGIDRRDAIEEGTTEYEEKSFNFDRYTPLYSVFNIINEDKKGKTNGKFKFNINTNVEYPVEDNVRYTSGQYTSLLKNMNEDLANKLKVNHHHFPSLLQWTESLWQFVPSSTNKNQLIDISLYDHSRITCAIATCIYDYLNEQNIDNYKQALFSNYSNTKEFYGKEAFLLLSMDMSGIQDFIYNISGSKALKSLRSRSFYLELMLEIIVDKFIEEIQVSRANLLYTGGGHAYLLTPNTEYVKHKLNEFNSELKEWFIQEFKTDLSVSIAYESCSGDDLMNTKGTYRDIWRNLSSKLSDMKSHKYNAEEIIRMNQTHSNGERECKECLRSDIEISNEGLCSTCEGIINISNDLRDKSFFIVTKSGKLKMPFNKYISVIDYDEAEYKAKQTDEIQIYSKNRPYIGVGISTNLWMCDYDYASKNVETSEMGIGSYIQREEGIQRLGVVRADIDNLGATFISGISDKYNSISRTATLSRQLSLFFKFELNNILDNYQITAIYSGGDDLFLIGSWDDIIDASIRISNHFKSFTLGKLTLSAGVGMFPSKYPISKMAFETGILEEFAKSGDKNQIALWRDDKVMTWRELEDEVLGEKLAILKKGFLKTDDHGKAFIYKILSLLRHDEKINIARLAYLLARSNMSGEFTSKIFEWSQNGEDKKQLITALEFYIYQIREAN